MLHNIVHGLRSPHKIVKSNELRNIIFEKFHLRTYCDGYFHNNGNPRSSGTLDTRRVRTQSSAKCSSVVGWVVEETDVLVQN